MLIGPLLVGSLLFGGIFVDDFVGGGDGEDGSFGLVAVDVGDGDDLLAGTWVVVFDDHVDGEVGRVPVLVDDDDGLAGAAHRGGDGLGLANARE